ncbi:MAG TPA: hypothetical protein PLP27_11560 [Crocinitomicaceae bacterium]|nr:hypothetical protein [Crocinitomicaceae bacterium]
MEKRLCLECSELLKGRKDQKFCSDYCRNAHNNKLNEDNNKQVRKINSILRKNRKILEKLNPKGKATVDELTLAELGFNFHYFTNIYKTQKGTSYYFVYDYGYLPIENGQYVLVLKQEYVK